MRRVYLDHSATTPLDGSALREMVRCFSDVHGNPSSVHRYGQEARALLDESRSRLAGLLGAKPGEVSFTGSGTEADNSSLKGAASAGVASGRNHVITTKAEHHAVLETCEYLRTAGCDVTLLDVDGSGLVDPDDVRRAITPRTVIVSVMHANNEIGSISPVAEIAAVARERGVLFHSDAVQSFGKIPLAPGDEGMDLCSLSAHKIYGPKGIGCLWMRPGVKIGKFVHGGGQERGLRAGTESVPLAVGFATAAAATVGRMEAEATRQRGLRDALRSGIEGRLPGVLINGHPERSLPGVLSISFDSRVVEIDGEALLFNLDLAGIAASGGSACTSGSVEPSHVILAIGRDARTAAATLRFSLGTGTVEEDIGYTVENLARIVERIGKFSAPR